LIAHDLHEGQRSGAVGTSFYPPAIGLLAVHASIALADAVLVSIGEKKGTLESQMEAVRSLMKACSKLKISSENGARSLRWLIERKTSFSYEDRYADENDLLAAEMKMEQFFTWVFQTFPPVAKMKEEAGHD